MGRKPTRWANLPKGMRVREGDKLIHDYFDTGGKAKLRMMIEGELEVLPTEIRAFKAGLNSTSPALLVNEIGKKPTTAVLRKRFDAARALAGITSGEFQFRDLRAKAATEADEDGGTRQAQGLLSHTTEAMTANYIRHKVGKKVKPLR